MLGEMQEENLNSELKEICHNNQLPALFELIIYEI